MSCTVKVSAMFPGWFGTKREHRQQWTHLTRCWATKASVVWPPSPPVFSLTCAVQCPLTSRSHCPLFSGWQIFLNLCHLEFHWHVVEFIIKHCDSCDCRTLYQKTKQNIQSPKSKPVSEALTEGKKSDQISAVSAWLEKWGTFFLQFSNKRSAPGGKSATRWKVCERRRVKFRTSENHKMMHSCYLWDIFRCYFELWQREHTTAFLKWVAAVISWFNSQHVYKDGLDVICAAYHSLISCGAHRQGSGVPLALIAYKLPKLRQMLIWF